MVLGLLMVKLDDDSSKETISTYIRDYTSCDETLLQFFSKIGSFLSTYFVKNVKKMCKYCF